MGLHVVAIDVEPAKLALARELGAKLAIDASTGDPAAAIQKEIGGAHGVLVTAVSRSAFAQALGMVRRGGTIALNGLPPGDFPLPIFSTVLNGITVRGSIVGTRRDLQESPEFAAEGKVRARILFYLVDRLENINAGIRRSEEWQGGRPRGADDRLKGGLPSESAPRPRVVIGREATAWRHAPHGLAGAGGLFM